MSVYKAGIQEVTYLFYFFLSFKFSSNIFLHGMDTTEYLLVFLFLSEVQKMTGPQKALIKHIISPH